MNLFAKSGALSHQEKMRGAYMNVGSKDIGPDPEWQRRLEELRASAAVPAAAQSASAPTTSASDGK